MRNVEEPTTPLLNVDWELINACGVIAMWCDSPEHVIAAYPLRLRDIDKGAIKLLALACQGPLPPSLAAVGSAYVMNKKEAAASSIVVTRTLFLNSKPFCVLFNSGATYSFIST